MYVVSFSSKEWVTGDDSKKWGLWNWCYIDRNTTGSQSLQCHGIAPGDSPGQYI